MDGTTASLIASLAGAISVLFSALLFAMRQSREDWKSLYEGLKKDVDVANEELRKQSSTNARLVELSFQQRREAERIRRIPEERTEAQYDEDTRDR